MKTLLEGMLPRIFPELQFLCVAHEGKQDLEKSIPRKLRGWREPGAKFLVLRDNDGADCRKTKRELTAMCKAAGREDSIVRLACEELEAWYFGEPEAIAQAYRKDDLRDIGRKAKYRDPDAIQHPSDELARILPEFQKVAGARLMAEVLSRENNRSRSFHALLNAVESHLNN